MAERSADLDVAVIGAGAAGLAAATTLLERGVDTRIFEASHRIGGRAYSEEVAPGTIFDLGCHWMHSASLNPFVAFADRFGFTYTQDFWPRHIHLGDRWADEAEVAEFQAFYQDCFRRIREDGRDVSVAEVTERGSRWTALFDYYISLGASTDSDLYSALDLANYRDTDENWPLKEGYGNLIARYGAGLPVELNAAVTRIDWSGTPIRLETAKGEIRARKAIVAVSTGILGGGDIRFDPPLPDWKQEAVAALPLGNHNRICLAFDRNVFGPDHRRSAALLGTESEPMIFRIRPFGYDYVDAVTGGRFADWLERAGIEASAELAKENLQKAFGTDITKHIVRHNVTAWRGDPWIKGAYSAALPGNSHRRKDLAAPIDERLFFAGEATSTEFFATAHGAYLSGIRAAKSAAASLEPSRAASPSG